METMDRKEALDILELPPAPAAQEIEHRYAIAVKRHRKTSDPAVLERITEAYNFLTGRTYVPEPPDPRDDRKVFGKTIRQWKHIWEYGRTKYIAITAGAIVLVSLVYSIATNTPPDFKFNSIGEIYSFGQEPLQAYIAKIMPEVKEFQYDSIYITVARDSELDPANIQKAFVLIAAGDEDLIAVDEAKFKAYGGMGAFLPLDDFYATLEETLPEDVLKGIVPRKAITLEADGGDGKEHVYGIEVTGLGTAQAIGIEGTKIIFTIHVRSKHLETTQKFISRFLMDTEALKATITPYPTLEPTTEATPTPTPAG